jgi:cholesterol transport system auxiliary component
MTASNHRISTSRRRLVGGVLLLPLAGLLGGCGVTRSANAPPPRQFQLRAPRDFPDNLPTVPWALAVERPEAARPLDTTRIAHLTDGAELQYYADTDWADRAPDLMHTLMLEAFRNSGKIEALAGDRTSLRPDFVLRPVLREFQAERSGDDPTSVIVLLTVSLIQMPKRNVVGATDIEALRVVQGGGIGAIVAAFDEAVGTVLRDVVVWTIGTGQAAAASA